MDPKLLRPALRLAVEVARDGELTDPPVPAPAGVRRLLTFRRLSASAYMAIAEAIEADEDFRRRVADAAVESEIGRVGMLWLTRPDGWERDIEDAAAAGPDDPQARAVLINRLHRAREGAEAAAERARADLADSETAREQLSERLIVAEDRARDDAALIEDLRREIDRLGEERNRAVRELKAVEAELSDQRHQLRVARTATREAERELAELRERRPLEDPEPSSGSAADGASDPSTRTPAEPFDRDLIREVIDGAAAAAGELARHLADAGRILSAVPPGQDAPSQTASGRDATSPARPARTDAPRRRRRRRRPELPFGAIEGTDRADRALVSDASNLLLVDGYNLARTLWVDCEPEEERRRTVALLEELHDRTGVEIVVVFDGADDTVAPTASRSIRVRFSPTGITADEVILDALDTIPVEQPVIVVSSDREVADGAVDAGATSIRSEPFARAARR